MDKKYHNLTMYYLFYNVQNLMVTGNSIPSSYKIPAAVSSTNKEIKVCYCNVSWPIKQKKPTITLLVDNKQMPKSQIDKIQKKLSTSIIKRYNAIYKKISETLDNKETNFALDIAVLGNKEEDFWKKKLNEIPNIVDEWTTYQ